MGYESRECSVCVTGAGGYIASWLIRDLLFRGYNINATFRDPGNESETGHILCLPGAKERLKLFKADIHEEGSFDSAVQGCKFVIHLAISMDVMDIDAEIETSAIEAEVNGTLDIMRACAKAKSVRRVIYTSSISAAFPLNDNGEFRACVDESCWTAVDLIRREKPLFSTYYMAKTLAEQAALQFGSDHGIEVVTIVPSLVAGPSITPTVPNSIEETLALITGFQSESNAQYYERLKQLQCFIGSIVFVHTVDVCSAHIFLMEHPSAEGRYICSSQSFSLRELGDFCCKRYPQFNLPLKFLDEDDVLGTVPVSSKRLLDMGFSYKYGLPEILDDSIEFGRKIGILP